MGEVKNLKKHVDERGLLVEILRDDEIDEEIKQVYFSITKPGAVRGNHYHKRKVEWFCVIRGLAKLVMEDIVSRERREYILNGKDPKIVKVPPGVAHAIQNIGDSDMYLVIIVNEVFDPNDPDTYYMQIL